MLQLESLAAGYGDLLAVRAVSLAVEEGECVALIGANGAGKTTTLRAVTGSLDPRKGRVWFKGEDVTHLPPHAKAARGLVLVPEGRQLFSEMSVEENLEMGAFSGRARAKFGERLDQVYTLLGHSFEVKWHRPPGRIEPIIPQADVLPDHLLARPHEAPSFLDCHGAQAHIRQVVDHRSHGVRL